MARVNGGGKVTRGVSEFVNTEDPLKGRNEIVAGRLVSWFERFDEDAVFIRAAGTDEELEATFTYGEIRSELEDSFPSRELTSGDASRRVAVILPRDESALAAVSLLCVMNCCVACPLAADLDDAQLLDAAKSLGCTAVITSSSLKKRIAKIDAFKVIVTGDLKVADNSSISWEIPKVSKRRSSNLKPQANESALIDENERLMLLLRTSGTTAAPKLVPLTANNLLYNALCLAKSLKLSEQDRCLSAMPLFHIGGLSCNLLAVVVSGSSVLYNPGAFDAEEFVEYLEGPLKPTWYYAVPTMHKAIIHFAEAERDGRVRTSLRFIRSGAAHLLHSDAVALRRIFGCPVLPTYSMTECMPVCAVPINYKLEKQDYVGPAIGPSLRIIALDEEDAAEGNDATPLPLGQKGQVVIRGPGVMSGYLGEDGDEFVQGGWLRTGDTGVMNAEGWISLGGRVKDIAKRGGEQISLLQVDMVASSHPQVSQAISFAIPNSFWGEEVVVAIVPQKIANSENLESQILHYCQKKMGVATGPSQVVFCTASDIDAAKNRTGKIVRPTLASSLQVESKDVPLVKHSSPAAAVLPLEAEVRQIAKTRPSKALYGLRFITACFVVQHHVGTFDFKAWEKIQTFTLNMSIFIILAGFMLAAANGRKIETTQDKRSFYIARLSATYPVYLLSLAVSLPIWFILRGETWGPPETNNVSENEASIYFSFALSLLLHLTGFQYLVVLLFGFSSTLPFFNGPTWFQTALYVLLLLFPSLDSIARQKASTGYTSLGWLLLVCVALATTVLKLVEYVAPTAILTVNFSFIGWLPAFFSGILAWHLFRKMNEAPASRKRKLLWGILADLLSITFGFLEFLVVKDDGPCEDYIGPNLENYIDCLTSSPEKPVEITWDMWWKSNMRVTSNRWSSPLGGQLGFMRLATPLLLLWLFALAHGSGITAWFLSNRVLLFFGPLAYPLYLLHVPCAYYVYFLVEGVRIPVGYPDYLWLPSAAAYPFPMQWWGLFLVIFICCLAGWLFNEFANPVLMPFAKKFWTFFFTYLCCMSGSTARDDTNLENQQLLPESSSGSVLDIVQTQIRDLTGAVVSSSDELGSIGLDSFGATALVGTLRAVLPKHARELKPRHVSKMKTVADLVAYLERAHAPTQDIV